MKKTIRIALNPAAQAGKRKKKFDSVPADVVGGLAIHKYEGSWRITHAQSGLHINGCAYADKKSTAVAQRKILLSAIDWIGVGPEVLARLQEAAKHKFSGADCVERLLYYSVATARTTGIDP